jgi:hypothetical protein
MSKIFSPYIMYACMISIYVRIQIYIRTYAYICVKLMIFFVYVLKLNPNNSDYSCGREKRDQSYLSRGLQHMSVCTYMGVDQSYCACVCMCVY